MYVLDFFIRVNTQKLYRTRRRFFTVLSSSIISSHDSTVISFLALIKLCSLDMVNHECILACVASFGSSCLFWTIAASMDLPHDSEISMCGALRIYATSVRISSKVCLSSASQCVVVDSFFVGRKGTTKPSVSSLNKIDLPSETATKLMSVGMDI